MRRALPIALVVLLFGLISVAIVQLEHPAPSTAPPPEATTTPAPPSSVVSLRFGRPTDRMAVIEGNIAFYRERTEADPRAWLDWEYLANTYLERARLTGDYADFRRAEDAFDGAFRAGNGMGPYLSRASFNLTMHRVDRIDADLDAAERGLMTVSDSDAVLAMRADARFYAGRYAEAREIYEGNLVRTRRSVDALVMLAQLEWHTGHFDEAEALLDEALASPRLSTARAAPTRSWVLMTRAMMERDRGRFDDALARLDEAAALSSEDPHLFEIAAEIHELRGDEDEALRAFREISSSTSSPQSIDGVARILRRRGDEVAAAELVGVARQTYEGQIALYPEAAWGHAIDHWLRLEPDDVDTMIAIAEGNAHARPYGETRIKLAEAYLLANRTADARRELDAVLATEWNTAELHAVNAITIEREGGDGSVEHATAESIAVGVTDRFGWLAGS